MKVKEDKFDYNSVFMIGVTILFAVILFGSLATYIGVVSSDTQLYNMISSDSSSVYTSPQTVTSDEGITSSSVQVYNQTWLEFDGVDNNVYVQSDVTDNIIYLYKNQTSDWIEIENNTDYIIIDGVEGTPVQSPVTYNGTHYILGYDGSDYFNGSIDNFRIYSSNGLLSQYRLNTQNFTANNQTVVLDRLGTNNGTLFGKTFNNGTASGGVNITDEVMVFDGVDDTIQLNSLGLGSITAISVSAWVKTDVQDDLRFIFDSKAVDSTNRIRLGQHTSGDGKWYFGIRDSGDGGNSLVDVYSNSAPSTTEYTHLVGHWNGTTIKLYVNGVLQSDTKAKNGTVNTTFATLVDIGSARTGAFFDGNIPTINIFNRALTQAEITQIYEAGKDAYSPITDGLQAQYSGRDTDWNGTAVTTVYDTNHLGDGKISEGYGLSSTSYFNVTVTGDKETIALWVKNSTGWFHVVNNSGTFYVNGQTGTPVHYPVLIDGDVISVGSDDVMVDDLRVINRTLSTDEILFIYNYDDGRESIGTLLSTQLKLNENSGTTAYDSSGNGNHGTISGAIWNNDGILNTLIDGVDYTLNTASGLLTMSSEYLYSWVITSWTYKEGYGFHVQIVKIIAGLSALIVLIVVVIYVNKYYEDIKS